LDTATQKRIAQAGKDVDPAWYRMHRNVSIHLTRAALALGLGADHATFAMMACGLVGAALLVASSAALQALGFVLLYLSFLLDKVDGELARLRGTESARGIFLDRMHHRLVEPCLFLAVAVHQHLLWGGLLPLIAGFATVLLANAIEENQHLAAYIVYKRAREGDGLPSGDLPAFSPRWSRAAALFRPLKGFRMFIVALPLAALAYVAQSVSGWAAPTYMLVASACALAVYLTFQCLHYVNGGRLEEESHAIARTLRHGADAPPRPVRRDVVARPESARNARSAALRAGPLVALAGLLVGAGVDRPAFAAGTYYVDGANPSCSDGGPGSPATPYCTIGAALTAQAGPNTTIHIAPGLYREPITIPGSGAAGSPLVLQGDGTYANPVLIDGSESFNVPALWTPVTGTTWLAASVNWNALMVLVDGVRLVPWAGSPDSIPSGGFRLVSGTGLYVNLGVSGSSGNPGNHETVVSKGTHGVFVNNRQWVTIRGLRIRQANDRGIQVTNSSNIVVENNVVERAQRFGIQAQGSNNVRIAGNRVTASGDHGISLTLGTTASTVELNESDHNARPGVRAANGIILFGAPQNVIRRNRLHHNQDSGMNVQEASDGTLAYQNRAWENGDHGFDHLAVSGTTHIGEVAWRNFNDGFSFEGEATNSRLYNSIATDNGETTGRYDLYVDSSSAISFASNDNIFWNAGGQEPVKYDKIVYATVGAYSFVSGQDTRSIQADPRFAAPQVGDFHLLAGSPAIDAANTAIAEWPGTDAEGFAPIDQPGVPNTGIGPVTYADRGAFEYGSGGVVGVPEDPARGISGVSPNPLPGRGQLAFTTARAGALSVELYDVRGRLVRSLLARDHAPGTVRRADRWAGRDGTEPAGRDLPLSRSLGGSRLRGQVRAAALRRLDHVGPDLVLRAAAAGAVLRPVAGEEDAPAVGRRHGMRLAAIAPGRRGMRARESFHGAAAVEADGDDLVAEALAPGAEIAHVRPPGTRQVPGRDVRDRGFGARVGEGGHLAVPQPHFDHAPERAARTRAPPHHHVFVPVKGIERHVRVLDREDPSVRAARERAAARRPVRHRMRRQGEGARVDLEDAMQVLRFTVLSLELDVHVPARRRDREIPDRTVALAVLGIDPAGNERMATPGARLAGRGAHVDDEHLAVVAERDEAAVVGRVALARADPVYGHRQCPRGNLGTRADIEPRQLAPRAIDVDEHARARAVGVPSVVPEHVVRAPEVQRPVRLAVEQDPRRRSSVAILEEQERPVRAPGLLLRVGVARIPPPLPRAPGDRRPGVARDSDEGGAELRKPRSLEIFRTRGRRGGPGHHRHEDQGDARESWRSGHVSA
jgi:phosphatidylglycerophosphate synthase